MRYCVAWLITLLGFVSGATAQNGPYQPGKIDRADLAISDCDFDKGAPALKLVDSRNIYYTQGENILKMMAQRQTRIKILKDAGLDYANVRIPYLSDNNAEKVTNIQAYTYNLAADGSVSVIRVDKKSIYSRKISKNTSEFIITFPQAKVGSVIEYNYTLQRDNLGYIEDWYFQDEIPVRYSEFVLRAPLLFNFSEDPFIYNKVEKKETLGDDQLPIDGTLRRIKILEKSYVMRNLPGIEEEPFMTSKNDYRQRISFQLAQTESGNGFTKDIRTTWGDIAVRLNEDEDFGGELRKGIPTAAAVLMDVKQNPDTLSRMIKLYNVVRNSIDWDGGYSIYALSGVRLTWQNKFGSSGDLNTILINLLRQAGIKAEPLLVSTRSNGTVNINYPSERQFNTLMAYVPIGATYYVLDATDKYSAYQLIPAAACNTWALRLTNNNSYEWVELLPRHNYNQVTIVQAAIDAAGTIKGNATVSSSYYAKAPQSRSWQEDETDFVGTYIAPYSPNINIDNLQLLNTDNDSLPLEQKIQFTLPLRNSGGYSYFSLNLFSGLGINPFTADERKSDIDFGYKQEYTLYGSYTLPNTHVFEASSGNFQIMMPDTSIICSINRQADDNLLRVRISVQFKQSYYLAANYPALQDFYKKMFAKLGEPIVVRKK